MLDRVKKLRDRIRSATPADAYMLALDLSGLYAEASDLPPGQEYRRVQRALLRADEELNALVDRGN